MAALPRMVIDEYTRQLNLVSDGMKKALADALEMVDWSDMNRAREQVLELMQIYCGGATDAAATLAARFYGVARQYELGTQYEALALSGRVPEATDKAVYSFFARKDATPEKITAQLMERIGYETKRAAGDCVFINGSRDRVKPRYARVPSGAETCQFCLMLGGRGFVYRSQASAGYLNHYHDNCDCRVVPSWGANDIEGYDPAAIAQQWSDSVEETARARAERNGTTEAEERKKIIQSLEAGASRAKGRRNLRAAEKAAGV